MSSICVFIFITKFIISILPDLDPIVFVSLFISCIIKSAFFTLIISILCFVGFFFDKKDSLDAEKIYEVFIDGKSVGYLRKQH